MSSGSTDSLSANGIVNFDVNTYLEKGTYTANGASMPNIPGISGHTPKSFVHPSSQGFNGKHEESDAFVKRHIESNETEKSSIGWTKVLAGGGVAALIIYAGTKIKSMFKNKKLDGAAKEITQEVTKTGGKIKTFFGNIKNKIKSWFSSEKVQEVAKEVKKETTEVAKNGKFIKGLKIAGIGAACLLGINFIFRLFQGNKTQPQQETAAEH